MRIIESLHMVKTVEDWSRVRSPSRARRRMKQGHRQNVVTRHVPRTDAITMDNGATYLMHPETAKEFARMVAEQSKTITIKPRSDPANPLYLGWVSPTLSWGGSLFAMTGNS